MKRIAEIVVGSLACAAVSAAIPGWWLVGSAAGAQVMPERSGPWAFSRAPAPGTQGTMQMATTPAAEDTNVWFLLVCDRARMSAAVMHVTGFPYGVAPEPAIVLRFAGHPDVMAEAQSANENQLAIADATARRLLPLVIGSERVIISIGDSDGGTHDYTFSLQPNVPGLAAIVRGCWDDG
jgi:hypothetical protein